MEGKHKKIIVSVIVLGMLMIAGYYYFYNSTLKFYNSVTFFDVGQGDSALIRFANGQKMLVDCGVNRKILSKLGSALPFFDRTIDYLLVTHPDGDHYGGCPAVLERYVVKNIITNGSQKSDDPYWLAWKKYSQIEQAQNTIISNHKIMTIGDSQLEFLAPDEKLVMNIDNSDSNNRSIVFALSNNLGKILFTGDMEAPLENAIIQSYCSKTIECPILKSDYLKVGHHGSDSSSGEYFLSLVKPKYAVVSVGANKYGHPSRRVLRKLLRTDAIIWRTDQKSDIIVK
ncbi:MAG: Late competence protein [uncultured bacterium]|nr:MAG: Late competence protein [uncultured bacterium]